MPAKPARDMARLSRGQTDGLLSLWPGVLFRQRADFAFEFISPNVETLTGVPVAEWQNSSTVFWDVVHELDAAELEKQIWLCVKRRQVTTTHYRIRNLQTGRVAHVTEYRRALRDGRGELSGFEGVWLEVTRQTIAEMRLGSAAWKETLAVITLGLAHDFNNILAGICSLSDTFLSQIKAEHSFHEGLTLISQNARQASQLVNRIAQLHRGKTGERSYYDLNAITADAVELLRQVLPRRLEITTDFSAVALPLYVDAVELRQVIINLGLNAADAMPDRGQVRFMTSLHQKLPTFRQFKGVSPRLPGCCLTVADTGCGIKAHHLESIFDPFFTTKAMNKGSGLGLYNAKLFAEKHHGAISVESVEGDGATFRVWLPQADFTEAESSEGAGSKRRRSILLVGPRGQALESMAEFLRLHNYQVFAVSQRAEEWLQSEECSFDGIILQVESPELMDRKLVSLVQQQRLSLKLVLQILACRPDQLETQFLLKADLIITPDMAEDVVLEKLRAMFEPRQGSG